MQFYSIPPRRNFMDVFATAALFFTGPAEACPLAPVLRPVFREFGASEKGTALPVFYPPDKMRERTRPRQKTGCFWAVTLVHCLRKEPAGKVLRKVLRVRGTRMTRQPDNPAAEKAGAGTGAPVPAISKAAAPDPWTDAAGSAGLPAGATWPLGSSYAGALSGVTGLPGPAPGPNSEHSVKSTERGRLS